MTNESSRHTTPTAADASVASMRVDHDVACRECGYNLRGLAVDGLCPECAAEVKDSLRGNWLRFAAPDYLKNVHTGLRLLQVTYTLGLVFIVGCVGSGCLLASLATAPGVVEDPTVLLIGIGLLAIGLLLTIAITTAIGCWKMARPDPLVEGRAARQVAFLRVTGLFLLPMVGAWVVGPPYTLLFPSLAYVAYALTYVAFVITWIHCVSMGTVQLALYRRCSPVDAGQQRKDEKLLRAITRSALWVPPALLVCHIGVHVMKSVSNPAAFPAPGGGGRPLPFPVPAYSGVGGILMTLLWLSSISATHRVRRMVSNEVEAATSGSNAPPPAAADEDGHGGE